MSTQSRAVVRCGFSRCRLNQFVTRNQRCRRCTRPLSLADPTPEKPKFGFHIAMKIAYLRQHRRVKFRNRMTLWAIENGKKIPSLVTLEQVADASGVGMKTLLDDSFPVFLLDPLTLAVQPLVKSLNLEARESILTTLKALANTETK